MFSKSLIKDSNAALCTGGHSCPDILAMDSGEFAVIGTDITEHAERLPMGSGCGPTERVVKIPRQTLIAARRNIPDA